MTDENQDVADTNEASEDQASEDQTVTEDQTSEVQNISKDDVDTSENSDDKSLIDKKNDDDKSEKEIEYEDFSIPEGMDVDDELLAGASELFREYGLTQEQGQRMVDLYSNKIDAAMKANEAAMVEQQKSWEKELKEDPVYGGDNFEKTTLSAEKAFAKFSDDETKQFFKQTNLGSHPSMIRLFKNIADEVLEDEISDGDKTTNPTSITDRWYKN